MQRALCIVFNVRIGLGIELWADLTALQELSLFYAHSQFCQVHMALVSRLHPDQNGEMSWDVFAMKLNESPQLILRMHLFDSRRGFEYNGQ